MPSIRQLEDRKAQKPYSGTTTRTIEFHIGARTRDAAGDLLDALHTNPAILLHHDGELGDIRLLLDELGVVFSEQVGSTRPKSMLAGWDLVIATPRRILHVTPSRGGPKPMLIAVLDGDSRTLRAHLRRVSVDIIVRRPVHPTALRLLILHAIYRGPERRDRERVSVGADVRFRSGLLPKQATLTELSMRGCRLLSPRPVAREKSIKLYLPTRVTGSKPLSLTGTVMRSGPAPAELPGLFVMGIRFDRTIPTRAQLLADTVEKHRAGPAVLPRGAAQVGAAARAEPETPSVQPLPVAEEANEQTSTDVTELHPVERERRQTDRHAYDKRIVALGAEATRVLLGRDISPGGMRIDPTPGLSVGDVFQLAVHATARDEPLVVRADVRRDDGEAGLVLGFETLNEEQSLELSRLVTHLPVLGTDGEAGAEAGLVVTEILERETG